MAQRRLGIRRRTVVFSNIGRWSALVSGYRNSPHAPPHGTRARGTGTRAGTAAEKGVQARALIGKATRQAVKDYVLFPALSRSRWRRTLATNATANLLRNLWAYVVIFCGHFPDGTEKFTQDVLEHETRPEWYLRQVRPALHQRFTCAPVFFNAANHQ